MRVIISSYKANVIYLFYIRQLAKKNKLEYDFKLIQVLYSYNINI